MRSETLHIANATAVKVAIVVSSYHDEITSKLSAGAQTAFIDAGGSSENCQSILVSGAWELPVVASTVASKSEVDAIVAIGCIISGETTHDQVIANAIAEGLMTVSITGKLPVSMGILTCKTIDQARERAGGECGNKGTEAMLAALSTIANLRELNS